MNKVIYDFLTFFFTCLTAFRPMARVSSNKLSMSFDLDKVLSTLASNKVITKVFFNGSIKAQVSNFN